MRNEKKREKGERNDCRGTQQEESEMYVCTYVCMHVMI